MPWFIPLAIAGATAAYQAIKGAKEKRDARRVQAEADARERANLAEANRMAQTGIPEAQYQRNLQQIFRQQATGLANLRDRRSALAGVPYLQRETNDALLNLNAADASARRQAQGAALNQANRISGLIGDRAAQLRSSGEALTGAAIQNISNAAGYAAMGASGGSGGGGGYGAFNTSFGGMGSANKSGYGFNTSIWGQNGYRGLNNNTYAKPF